MSRREFRLWVVFVIVGWTAWFGFLLFLIGCDR
jgi:hypothetical protein